MFGTFGEFIRFLACTSRKLSYLYFDNITFQRNVVNWDLWGLREVNKRKLSFTSLQSVLGGQRWTFWTIIKYEHWRFSLCAYSLGWPSWMFLDWKNPLKRKVNQLQWEVLAIFSVLEWMFWKSFNWILIALCRYPLMIFIL